MSVAKKRVAYLLSASLVMSSSVFAAVPSFPVNLHIKSRPMNFVGAIFSCFCSKAILQDMEVKQSKHSKANNGGAVRRQDGYCAFL
jgi:hypothetical protein